MTDSPVSDTTPSDGAPTGVPIVEPGAASPRRVPVAAISSAIVAVVMIGLLAVFLATDDTGVDDDRRNTVGDRLELSGPTLAGGTFNLADRRGTFVLVNFFATWCIPCRTEHPELVEFSKRRAAIGDASVVSVAYEDSPEELARFFAQFGGDWPVVIGDGVGRIATDFGVVKLPESYLVDPSGRVIEKFVGGVTVAEVDAAIAAASGSAASGSSASTTAVTQSNPSTTAGGG